MRTPPEFKIAQTPVALEISGEIGPASNDLLSITIEGRRLKILHEGEDGSPPFEQVIRVPAAYDLSQASANYLEGVLRITVPGRFQWN